MPQNQGGAGGVLVRGQVIRCEGMTHTVGWPGIHAYLPRQAAYDGMPAAGLNGRKAGIWRAGTGQPGRKGGQHSVRTKRDNSQ